MSNNKDRRVTRSASARLQEAQYESKLNTIKVVSTAAMPDARY